MNRAEVLRRLASRPADPADALPALRALLAAIERVPPSERPPARLAAAERLLEQIRPEIEVIAPPGTASARREALEAAVTRGPDALGVLAARWRAEADSGEAPKAELAALALALRGAEVRGRCIDHLEAIFGATRSRP